MGQQAMNLPHEIILKVRTGSRAHGVHLPGSDNDIRGVAIPDIHYFLGLKNFEQYENREDDVVIYGIKKFVKLACKGNVSVLNMLFVDNKDLLQVGKLGQRLIDFRQEFISERVIKAVLGYINSQLHRMKRGSGRCGNREGLIKKYGFDTKFAYHAVMLTNIAIDLLKRGTYLTLRKPAEQDYLRQIRVGKVTYQEVMNRIEENFGTIKTLRALGNLKSEPDEEKISEFLVDLLVEYFTKSDLGDRREQYGSPLKKPGQLG